MSAPYVLTCQRTLTALARGCFPFIYPCAKQLEVVAVHLVCQIINIIITIISIIIITIISTNSIITITGGLLLPWSYDAIPRVAKGGK